MTSISTDVGRTGAEFRPASASLAAIGVLDSGLGGLSIVQALQLALPGESILYFADSAYCPYGERDESFIRSRTVTIAQALQDRGAKAMVIACNTACAFALDHVRGSVSIPVVGLEPAVKPAVAVSRKGRIAVFATPRTVASDRLSRLVQRYASDIEVELIAAPVWVELVEQGDTVSETAFSAVKSLVEPAVTRGADVLVLGCTHFPFLTSLISGAAGPDVAIVDSGMAIARRTRQVLEELDLLAPDATECRPVSLLTTSPTAGAVRVQAGRMLGSKVQLV